MAYDLEEQEQLDALRAWWKTNGNNVLWAMAALCVAFAGFQSWKYYQRQQSLAASSQYEALAQLDPKDVKQVRSISGQLMEKYPSTPYAARVALMAAKANYEAGDVKSARAQVEWAMSHAKEDAVKAIAFDAVMRSDGAEADLHDHERGDDPEIFQHGFHGGGSF